MDGGNSFLVFLDIVALLATMVLILKQFYSEQRSLEDFRAKSSRTRNLGALNFRQFSTPKLKWLEFDRYSVGEPITPPKQYLLFQR